MSSVHAVTEDIVFTAKVASFYPIEYNELSREFCEWLTNKQHDYHMILYRTSIEVKEKNVPQP